MRTVKEIQEELDKLSVERAELKKEAEIMPTFATTERIKDINEYVAKYLSPEIERATIYESLKELREMVDGMSRRMKPEGG